MKISDQDPIEGEAIFTITIPEERKKERHKGSSPGVGYQIQTL